MDHDLPAAVRTKLDRFAALLLRWNQTLNLVAAKDAEVLWQRHIQDSLQLLLLLPSGVTRGIDLGSGAGFPGLVLAIATGLRFELIESDRRKAAFLRAAVLETGAAAEVHACRIEQVRIEPALLLTARALAPLPKLLHLAAPLLAPHGVCLFLKGAKAGEELAAAEPDWAMTVTTSHSRTGADGVVLAISQLRKRREINDISSRNC